MKKTFFLFFAFTMLVKAQFSVQIKGPADFGSKEAYLYTLNGSKDMLLSKIEKKDNSWNYKVPNYYMGMMKIYFPESNNTFNFISENKDVDISFDATDNKIADIYYHDPANQLMDDAQDFQRKKEQILPALYQIKEYYRANSDFGIALNKEIDELSNKSIVVDPSTHPFVDFYKKNYQKFLVSSSSQPPASPSEIVDFLSKSADMLESSSLMRPIILDYLNQMGKSNPGPAVDNLLSSVNLETPRGQIVLSELIDIFDAYGMTNLRDKYLAQAGNLKCTINDRLASTLKMNKNVALGAKFPNYVFNDPRNTTAKSLFDLKADKKVVVFWSSTCSHCEQELPQFIPVYNKMKAQNIQIVGLSLDTKKEEYQNKASSFPWINDTELRGWNSTFAETYNLHGTPTYFVLDSQNKIIAKPDHVGDVLQFLNLK